jgi:hypothetical protein
MGKSEVSKHGKPTSPREWASAAEEAKFIGKADIEHALRNEFPVRALRPLEPIEMFAGYLARKGVVAANRHRVAFRGKQIGTRVAFTSGACR